MLPRVVAQVARVALAAHVEDRREEAVPPRDCRHPPGQVASLEGSVARRSSAVGAHLPGGEHVVG